MDWRELQEKERIRRTRLLIREEISAVLEDIREVTRKKTMVWMSFGVSRTVGEIIDTVQTKIKKRGTDGSTT